MIAGLEAFTLSSKPLSDEEELDVADEQPQSLSQARRKWNQKLGKHTKAFEACQANFRELTSAKAKVTELEEQCVLLHAELQAASDAANEAVNNLMAAQQAHTTSKQKEAEGT